MRNIKYAIWLLTILVCSAPAIVSAHAELVSSTPEAGSTLDQAPSTVTAVFSEKLGSDGSTMTVVDEQGTRVDAGDARIYPDNGGGKNMIVSLKPNLGGGTYTVKWTSLSADDGDKEDGTFTFTVKASNTASASPAASPSAAASASPAASPSVAASASSAADSASSDAAPAASQTTLPNTGADRQPLLWLTAIALLLCVVGMRLARQRRHS